MQVFKHFASIILPRSRPVIFPSKKVTSCYNGYISTTPPLRNLSQRFINNSSCCGPLMDVCGKTAIVTGAANGMGYSITQYLLYYGAKVLMVDIDKETGCKAAEYLCSQYGRGCVEFYHGDITCESHQKTFFSRCCECFGQVNIVINNANVWDAANWTKEVEVNFKAVMDIMQLAFQFLTDCGNKGGLVINMSSTLALKPYGVSPIYSGVKRSTLGLTRSLSDDFYYKKYKIRMCTLCPGIICTSLLESARQNMPCGTYQEEFDRVMACECKHNPEVVGAATIHLIREAPHGTTWVIDEGDLYMVDFPHYKCYSIPNTLRVVESSRRK